MQFCEFTLKSDLTYVVKFPGRQKLDPITAYAAGHSGLDGMGIILTENYTMGLVLSKLVDEEEEADWMLLDLTPEEKTPLPRIPEGAVEEARKILEGYQLGEPVETFPTVTPIPTMEQIQITAQTIAAPEPVQDGLEELDELDAAATAGAAGAGPAEASSASGVTKSSRDAAKNGKSYME